MQGNTAFLIPAWTNS